MGYILKVKTVKASRSEAFTVLNGSRYEPFLGDRLKLN